MVHTYILDTNVLLNDVNCLNAFEENNIIIPLIVIEELDNNKSRMDDVGRAARQISRQLDEYRKLGSLNEGVILPSGGLLKVLSTSSDAIAKLPSELQTNFKADNAIIAFAYELKQTKPDCILVSRDINVRLKCDSLKINTEDYLSLRVVDAADDFYSGYKSITLTDDEVNTFFRDKVLPNEDKLYPNQFVILRDSSGEVISTARSVKGQFKALSFYKDLFGLKPKNLEQEFAIELLMDPEVKLVTLVGKSGSGKSVLAVAAGLQQLLECEIYDKLIVTRPVQPLGKDIGFLPGTLEEKMAPWVAPIHDAITFLTSSRRKKGPKKKDEELKRDPYIDLLFENGKIEVEAITYIRGRSIPNSFILVDESQNLSMHEIKTILTRASEGTKIVLTGDVDQIDNVHVDAFTNGLTYAIEKFKEYDISGHVTLTQGERSELASLAAKIL